jgi:hypothetical protein
VLVQAQLYLALFPCLFTVLLFVAQPFIHAFGLRSAIGGALAYLSTVPFVMHMIAQAQVYLLFILCQLI